MQVREFMQNVLM